MIREYLSEVDPHPVFTVADGLIALSQNVQRNSMVCKMQVLKMRGKATHPGMHPYRITSDGVEIFPMAIVRDDTGETSISSFPLRSQTRLAMGVPGLDEMLGGGLPSGYSLLVAGPSGSGKTILATAFLAEGVRLGELAVAPAFREDFRESLFRMVAVLAGLGVTVLLTSELEDRYTDLRFSPYGSAFLTDAIIVQRYIEVESTLQRVIAVVKVRASNHSTEIRQFEITDGGINIGERVFEYEGILGGQPARTIKADTIDQEKPL
ncbi:MAG: hypothetical protein PF495_15585 [Spirochaetales bacterium]|jgi:circadian clock protein KaiC|nr:hypothetical protein [Spirochaetales bacterium]